MRAAEWSSSTVSIAASPGATIFGPPENPAKKCGSMNPSVIRTSWSRKRRSSIAGPPFRRGGRRPGSRRGRRHRGWTTCTRESVAAPNIASSSPGVQARCVPVATKSVTAASGISSSSTGSTDGRECAGHVAHGHADARPRRHQLAHGGPCSGRRIDSRRAPAGFSRGAAWRGRITVAGTGSRRSRPARPYASRTTEPAATSSLIESTARPFVSAARPVPRGRRGRSRRGRPWRRRPALAQPDRGRQEAGGMAPP